MEGHRSRSYSQSSSSSSRSWSLIENPELELRGADELTDLKSSCNLTYCEYQCTETGERFEDESDINEYDSGPDSDDVSGLDESVELLSGSVVKRDIDVRKVWHQLDLLSKFYEPPMERFLNCFFELDSHIKMAIVLVAATLLLTVGALLKVAGDDWNYVPRLDPRDSVCVLDEEQVLGLQYREHCSMLTRQSAEAPLRPTLESVLPPSLTPARPPLTAPMNRMKGQLDVSTHSPTYQRTIRSIEEEHKRRFSAMNEAVRRYVRHTRSRKPTIVRMSLPAMVHTEQPSSDVETAPSGVNRPHSGWCTRWPIPQFNFTVKKPTNVFNAIRDINVWKNVTASLLRIPKAARKLLGTGVMIKVVAESKLAHRVQNAFSFIKKSISRSMVNVNVQRHKVIRTVKSWRKLAKTAFRSRPKLWSKVSQWMSVGSPAKEEYVRNDNCHSLATLGYTLESTQMFALLAGSNNAKEYIHSLMNGSMCSKHRIDCEKCWWTHECPKKKCKFLLWRQLFDTQRFIASERDAMLKPFAMLGWPFRHPPRTIYRRKDFLWKMKPKKATYIRHSNRKDQPMDRSVGWIFKRGQRCTLQRGIGAH